MADEVTFGSAGDLLVRKLIQARKERGLSLEEVSDETRIKKDHLEKIEAGNLTILPSAYVYAFLKEYAQALDINDAELLESCRDELSIPTDPKIKQDIEAFEEETASSKGDRFSGMFDAVANARSVNSTALLAGAAALIVLILLAVSYFVFSEKPPDEPGVTQQEVEAPVPVAEVQPELAEEVPDPVAVEDTLAVPAAESVPVLAVKQEEWAKDVSFLPESSTSPYRKILIVRITNDLSWVKIIADDGDMVYPGGQFKAGEVLRYEAKRKFWVNIGRPPYVELYLNGEKVPPLSKRTIVLGEE